MDHAFTEAVRCAHQRGQAVRALLRAALTAADETVDASTWTRAADTRAALDAMDQALMFCEEAYPPLKGDED
jgi:hypothetical protein